MKLIIKISLIGIFLLGVFSCQSLTRAFLGIKKNADIYVDNVKRIKYYKPFFNHKSETIIYSLKDTSALFKGYRLLSDIPLVYIENNQNNKLYQFKQCYDDVEDQVEDINNKRLYDILMPIEPKENDSLYIYYKKWKELISNGGQIVYTDSRDSIQSNKVWNILFISGTFLGNKLRNRASPIQEIEGLKKLTILDLSVNKEDGKVK